MSKKIKLGRRRLQNKISLFGKAVDFPTELFSSCAHITLLGNRELTVDGCYGIVEYNECLVRLNIGDRLMCVTGQGLNVYDYNGNALSIKGNILNIEYCS